MVWCISTTFCISLLCWSFLNFINEYSTLFEKRSKEPTQRYGSLQITNELYNRNLVRPRKLLIRTKSFCTFTKSHVFLSLYRTTWYPKGIYSMLYNFFTFLTVAGNQTLMTLFQTDSIPFITIHNWLATLQCRNKWSMCSFECLLMEHQLIYVIFSFLKISAVRMAQSAGSLMRTCTFPTVLVIHTQRYGTLYPLSFIIRSEGFHCKYSTFTSHSFSKSPDPTVWCSVCKEISWGVWTLISPNL